MSPEISIIVPVYGVELYLDRCVQSLLAQTYTDIEIILVDDGSPDRCPEMCDAYADQHEHIHVVHKPNGGLSSARLAGFRKARGKYCIFIDSDDYVDNKMIEVLHTKAVETDSDLTICSWYTDVAGKITPHYWNTGWDVIEHDEIKEKYFLPLVGQSSGCDYLLTGFMGVRLIRRSFIVEEMFVSEREYIIEDVLFHLMLCTKLNQIAMVDEPHYYYYFNDQSLTNKYREGAWEKMYAFYRFVLRLCEENGVRDKATVGLQFRLMAAVAFSILNACRKNDYAEAKQEIHTILTHPEVSEMFRTISRDNLTLQYKVIYLAWKTGLYYLMYKYLRWRMKL